MVPGLASVMGPSVLDRLKLVTCGMHTILGHLSWMNEGYARV